MQNKLQIVKDLIHNSNNITFLTGAGISVSSGIPSFRGNSGLYSSGQELKFINSIFNYNEYIRNPDIFWEWYNKEGYLFFENISKAIPNIIHNSISSFILNNPNKNVNIITQNIDGLHGNSNQIIEIHGKYNESICPFCKTIFSYNIVKKTNCNNCNNGILKPNITFFNENINTDKYTQSIDVVMLSDIIICIGASAEVEPVRGFPKIGKKHGSKIIEINPERTFWTYKKITDYYFQEIGENILPLIL